MKKTTKPQLGFVSGPRPRLGFFYDGVLYATEQQALQEWRHVLGTVTLGEVIEWAERALTKLGRGNATTRAQLQSISELCRYPIPTFLYSGMPLHSGSTPSGHIDKSIALAIHTTLRQQIAVAEELAETLPKDLMTEFKFPDFPKETKFDDRFYEEEKVPAQRSLKPPARRGRTSPVCFYSVALPTSVGARSAGSGYGCRSGFSAYSVAGAT